LAGYGWMEREIARALERFPRIRTAIKEPYKRLSYMLNRKAGFQYELHPSVRMLTPEEWAGLEPSDSSLFFGYYDKSPFSQEMTRAVFHQELGTGDEVEIVALDQKEAAFFKLGSSRAWNWQQGSMTQWVPGRDDIIIHNCIRNGELGCRLVELPGGGEAGFLGMPIQTLHPNQPQALSLNYRRLMRLRPDYGYRTDVDNFQPGMHLSDDGIWLLNLESGESRLVFSLAELAERPGPGMVNADHKVNHAIYSRSGTRFVFMHRWLGPQGKFSRLYSARSDGSDLTLLMESRLVSHYHWRDEDTLVVYGRAGEANHYYLVNAADGDLAPLAPEKLDGFGDGHCSFSPDGRWIVSDTYPDKSRVQTLFLFKPDTGDLEIIGGFLAPPAFNGPERCDLHPRFSPDGRWVSIDSSHTGHRGSYFLYIGDVLCDDSGT
jgi:hypothetical protein